MSYIQILLHVILLVYIYPQASDSTDLSNLQALCPYTQFCSGSPANPLNGTQPCCLSCSCSDTCAQLGTCCPDKSDTVDASWPPNYFTCKYQSELYQEILGNKRWDNDLNVLFRVINACPADKYMSESILDFMVIQGCHEPTDLENLAFVSDLNGEHIYFNKYCAQCNGVVDVTKWDLLINCPDFLDQSFHSFENWEQYVFEHCTVLSQPPKNSGIKYMSSICFIDSIDKCNQTGLWDFHEPELIQKCESYNLSYIDDTLTQATYTNVFCYLCNVPKGTPVRADCAEIEIFARQRTVFYPLTVMLAVTDYKAATSQETVKSSKCDGNEIEDPVTLQCKTLICPHGYLSVDGACRRIFNNINGFCIQTHFELKLTDEQMSATRQSDDLLANAIVTTMASTLKIYNAFNCKFNGVTLIQVSPNIIDADIIVHSTEDCDYLNLLQGVAAFYKKGYVHALLDAHMVSLPMFWTSNWELSNILWYHEERQYACAEMLTFYNDTVVCPSVQVNPNDFHDNKSELLDDVIAHSVKITEDEYRICVEEYESLLNQRSTASMPDKMHCGKSVYVLYIFVQSFTTYSVFLRLLNV